MTTSLHVKPRRASSIDFHLLARTLCRVRSREIINICTYTSLPYSTSCQNMVQVSRHCQKVNLNFCFFKDIWSSLSVPSGLGCATVIYPDSAALMAAQIIGLQDYIVWARLRVKQLETAHSLRVADKKLKNLTF